MAEWVSIMNHIIILSLYHYIYYVYIYMYMYMYSMWNSGNEELQQRFLRGVTPVFKSFGPDLLTLSGVGPHPVISRVSAGLYLFSPLSLNNSSSFLLFRPRSLTHWKSASCFAVYVGLACADLRGNLSPTWQEDLASYHWLLNGDMLLAFSFCLQPKGSRFGSLRHLFHNFVPLSTW